MNFSIESRLREISVLPNRAKYLPGSSKHFGPPRRWATVSEYASRLGLETRVVEKPELIARPEPIVFGAVDDYFLSKPAMTIPAKQVISLNDACVYGPDGSIVAADDTFLWDTAWHEGGPPAATFRGRALFRRKRARARVRLSGRTAAISSDWAVGGFGHFLTDALPRWRLLLAAGFNAGSFEQVALFHPSSPTVRFLINAAGVPSERIVPYLPASDYQCEELVATTFPGAVPAISPSSITWLRGLAGSREGKKRVYITRAGYRRHPANAGEIESELLRRGFISAHGDDGTAALEACAGARLVIGVEGSNLLNICFAPPYARIVLLLPGPDTIPYIPFICEAGGLQLAIVPAAPGSDPNFPVFPLSAVSEALDWAESSPAP